MQPEEVTQAPDQLPGEVVAALYYEDQKPLAGPAAVLDWRLDGRLTRMLLDGAIRGRAGEHVLLQGNGKISASWVLFVGGGKWRGLSVETHAVLVEHLLKTAAEAGFSDVSLALSVDGELAPETVSRQVATSLQKNVRKTLRACRYTCTREVSV